jgi:N-acetyl-anhydromuramyl-L-alanine amidase AmpD
MPLDLSTVIPVDVSHNTIPQLKQARNRVPAGVVIHTTIGTNSLNWLQRGSYEAWLRDPVNYKPASCDKLIGKDGKIYILTQWHEMSYHAGVSRWRGRQDENRTLNRTHLGYEIETLDNGTDVVNPAQYLSAAASYAYDCARGRMHDVDLCAHAWCALPPGRKSDPAWFDWGYFWGLVWAIRREWPQEWADGGVPRWDGGGR